MSKSYYPSRNGDQVLWLNNFATKINAQGSVLGLAVAEVTAIMDDAITSAWLLDAFAPSAQTFGESVTAYVQNILHGGAPAQPLPTYIAPTSPPAAATVAPDALGRIFAFVRHIKTLPAYTVAIGEDLGIVAPTTGISTVTAPETKAQVLGSNVLLFFKKNGHLGVWIEIQDANEAAWTYLAIDTSSPYTDSRPLKVPGQPEKRRYRVCFWDDVPTYVWSPVLEVVFGA